MRTSRPVAKASIFSASMSNGLAVAISRYESVWPTGTTLNRRATCSGTACCSLGSTLVRSATGIRNRLAMAWRICSSARSLRWTRISQSEPGADAGSWRMAATVPSGRSGSMVCTSHSSVNCIDRLWRL